MSIKIKLSKGFEAIIDDDDYELIMKRKWYCGKNGYPTTGEYVGNYKTIQTTMHRYLMNPIEKEQVDHINGNKLDNRRSNLRIVTHSQNMCNRNAIKNKKYKGVFYDPRENRWYSKLIKEKKYYWVGCFKTEDEAALAYNLKAIEIHGEFARLNVIY